MKTLYIVRHAKSSWKFPDLSDHDRPLNARGERDAPKMGERLHQQGVMPEILISSIASRVFATAQKIATGFGFPLNQIIPNSDLFHAAPSEILDVVHNVDNAYQSAMIFGHNPGFTWISNQLANSHLRSGGVAI